jgi:RNA polymerase sigma-70 factor (ECF subfamily)
MMTTAAQTVEEVARNSYGRLVAYLAARSRDLAAAEDALGDAFLAALDQWPRDGVPQKPEAWLLTAARRRLIDASRRAVVADAALPTLEHAADDAQREADEVREFPDERLGLLFCCAHPAIDPASRTPLMLQTVLGLDAARIASAFLVAPSAMSQRLVRAKSKIRDAAVPFELPSARELPDRAAAVMEAIYAAYGTAWDDAAGVDARRRGLADEAIWLARVLVRLLPADAEAHGLLSLMLFCESRRAARRAADGAFVPLDEQNVALWSVSMIDEAEAELCAAAALATVGHFQLEAAIQSVHAQRLRGAGIHWPAVAALYEQLTVIAPTVGAIVGMAAAYGEAGGAPSGLAVLDSLADADVAQYQPYWAVRAHLLAQCNRADAARRAYERAVGLSEDEAVRRFLLGKMSALNG